MQSLPNMCMCQVEGGCWQFIGKTKDNPKWGKEFSLKHDTIDLKFISSNFSSRAEVKFCLQWFWKVILQSLLKISRTQCFWGQLLLEWISVLLVCSDYWALTHSLFTGYKGFQLPARKPCIFFFFLQKRDCYSCASLCFPEVMPQAITILLACILLQIAKFPTQILQTPQCT